VFNLSKKGKRSQNPSVMSAAGLVRYFEDVDLKIALKPYLIILMGFLFVVVVVILSKLVPPA
jgi:preprotein translocase subunit Sec61beta